MVRQPQSDYDSPWKEALDLYFEDFIAFFFPEAHSDINWQRNYESLDTELQEVVRDAETGRRLADKLVKIWLQSGEETWVLVHIEVQSKADSDFGKRMYVYNHRLFDRYNREVVSLAVLGDDQQNWRPMGYGYAKWGFQSSLQFPVVKLLDYQQRWSELEQSLNPFAIIVMAHLKTQATRRDYQGRLQWKLSLIRRLYERGYSRDQILQLFRLIEWMMVLPRELELSFRAELRRYQEERRMPYITGFEIDGMVQAHRENIIEVLETRFETVPQGLSDRINEIDDLALLKSLHKRAITVASVEEFEQVIASI
jgi:hypothetical protein